MGVEPVTEHLDGAVDGDVLGDGKGSHGGSSIPVVFTALLGWHPFLLRLETDQGLSSGGVEEYRLVVVHDAPASVDLSAAQGRAHPHVHLVARLGRSADVVKKRAESEAALGADLDVSWSGRAGT